MEVICWVIRQDVPYITTSNLYSMKSLVNRFLCAGLYIMVVHLSRVNPLLHFKPYRKKMEKNGYLKPSDGAMLMTPKYYNMMRDLLASVHFQSESVFFSCGTFPLWMLLGKKFGDSYILSMLLCFGIPFLMVEYFVLKDDIWMKYWKQIEVMSSCERRKTMIITCITYICLLAVYLIVYITCMPTIKNMR